MDSEVETTTDLHVVYKASHFPSFPAAKHNNLQFSYTAGCDFSTGPQYTTLENLSTGYQ